MAGGDAAQHEQVQKGFEQTLNRHGYGFQYSVVQQAEELFDRHKSGWRFEATEFPVGIQGRDTRIDILFRHRATPIYLLAECKRANPALSNWCFAPSPHVHGGSFYKSGVFERVQLNENNVYAFAKTTFTGLESYHVALEVKSNDKGDTSGARREAIEDAATQVLRGLNGMVEFLVRHPQFFEGEQRVVLLPVIFTTAHLWTSNIDLGEANRATGNIDLSKADFRSEKWLLYQYHTGPGLKHSYSPSDQLGTISAFMEREYIRTIPIVSPSGIADFLGWARGLDVH